MSQISYVGQIVKEERNRKDISQNELAARTGVSKSTIEKFESGKRSNITLDNLISIFSELDLPAIPLIKSITQQDEKRSKLLNDIIGHLACCDMETLRMYHISNVKLIEVIQQIADSQRG
jgi:transcriptional regulator with XRE-family HTH domain